MKYNLQCEITPIGVSYTIKDKFGAKIEFAKEQLARKVLRVLNSSTIFFVVNRNNSSISLDPKLLGKLNNMLVKERLSQPLSKQVIESGVLPLRCGVCVDMNKMSISSNNGVVGIESCNDLEELIYQIKRGRK